MTVTELKPRIRPVVALGWRYGAFGRTGAFLWECRSQRFVVAPPGIRPDAVRGLVETYGKRGHGYTPAEAYREWKAQQ